MSIEDVEGTEAQMAARIGGHGELNLLSIAIEALGKYADKRLWENCFDDGENGLHRKFITGTSHPASIAQIALKKIMDR